MNETTIFTNHNEISLVGIQLLEKIPNLDLEDKIKEHNSKKKLWRSENSKKLGILLFSNYMFFIWFKEMQIKYIQLRIDNLNDPIINFNYEILYWVPNIITSLVFGFICDYIGNDSFIGGYKSILSFLHFPLLFGQIFILLSVYNQNEKIIQIYFMFGKFLYSISGETIQSFIYGYITLWFKYENQIEIICLFTFAGCCGCLIKELLFFICYETNEILNYNSMISIFSTYLGFFSIVIFLLLNLLFFVEEEVNLRDSQFFKKIKSEYKKNKELDEKENIFPSSFCNTFHLKLLKIRLLLIAIVHGIIYSVKYMMMASPNNNIIMNFQKTYFNNNNNISFIYIISFNIIKAYFSVFLIPKYLTKTGNRNLLLFFGLILNIISLGYFYNFSKYEYYNQSDIFKIFLLIPTFLFELGSSLLQIIFFTYIPLLVSEEYYMSAYGFLSCVQSIFIVALSICNFKFRENDKDQQEFLEDLIFTMIILLIFALLLFIFLEYYDRSKINKGKNPKLNRIFYKETRYLKKLQKNIF